MARSSKKARISKKKGTVLQAPKGMHDILPEEQPWWDRVREAAEKIADSYGFSRIDTPIVEEAAVFERGIGGVTDIVEKQMFYLKTKGESRLVLRPENTASIVRAYLEHGLSHLSQPLKLYYIGPMFRYEQPQAGRYRQFHQIGFEILGAESDSLYDAQLILATLRTIEELKIKKLMIQLNSIGCNNCRPNYKRRLTEYYRKLANKICKDCRRRLNVNPLRLLDCKNENCEAIKSQAPMMIDYLCLSCRAHFKGVLEYLDDLNLPYTLNSYLVRGLDYYNRTVFEISTEESGIALAGGGRYDYLGEMLGLRRTELPAVGGSMGIERLIETMKAQGIVGSPRARVRVFLVQIGEEAKKKSLDLIEKFRQANIKIGEALGRGSLKAQLRLADKTKADMALLFGQREVFEGSIIIRDMKSGSQETVPLGKVVEEVKKRLKS